MKKIAVLKSIDHIQMYLKYGVSDLIIPLEEISRCGGFKTEKLPKILSELEENNINAHLEWDILMTDGDFLKISTYVKQLPLEKIQSVRVLDPGAAQFLLEESNCNISPILEGRNHNLIGITKWKDILGDRLGSLILSQELSEKKLTDYISELNVSIEVLAFGKILLFYSPRALLTKGQEKKNQKEQLELNGNSEESPHNGFLLIENIHGTLMFNPKEFCILEHLEQLRDMNVDYMRIDQRLESDVDTIEKVLQISTPEQVENFKKIYPKKLIKGFFRVNKSDVLFKKLKNKKIQRQDENYIGEVVEVQKKKVIGIKMTGKRLSIGDSMKLITPDGKEKIVQIKSLRDLSLKEVPSITGDSIALISHTSGVSVKTQVYLE